MQASCQMLPGDVFLPCIRVTYRALTPTDVQTSPHSNCFTMSESPGVGHTPSVVFKMPQVTPLEKGDLGNFKATPTPNLKPFRCLGILCFGSHRSPGDPTTHGCESLSSGPKPSLCP